MLWSKISRTLKRRLIYGLVAVIVMTYGIVNIAKQFRVEKGPAASEDESAIREPRKPFRWHLLSNDDNATDNLALTCRNSLQGRVLLADDRGYICRRSDLLPTGCCNPGLAETKRFSCDSCLENHCCGIYENCLSCCLSPEKKSLLQNVMARASGNFKRLYDSVADHFELCLVKCRTSSLSVQHENSYRDPQNKHCFGEFAPSLHSQVH